MANKVPIFARASTLEVLEYALNDESGILYDLDRICYVYLIDSGELCYVDAEKNIYPIVGANKPLVQKVDALPPAVEADENVLYIYNNIVYIWNGEQYLPTFYEVAIQIDSLTEQLNILKDKVEIDENAITDLTNRLGTVESTVSSISSSISQLSRDINALDQIKADADDVYTKSEVDALLEVETPSGVMTLPEYVDTSVSSAVETAQTYTDQQLRIHFV